MPQATTATLDDEYGLEPATSAGVVTDDQYGLEPAKPATAKVAPTRKPGEARLLTPEEVNKFQPPTALEKNQTPSPENTGVWGRTKQYVGDLAQMGKGLVDSVPGMGTIGHIASGDFKELPLDLLPGARTGVDAIKHLTAVKESDVQRKEEGRSLPYRVLAGGAQATGIADPTSMEESARHGDPMGVLTHAAAQATPFVLAEAARTPLGKKVTGAIGEVPSKVGSKVSEMRQPGRIANYMDVLRELTGKKPADLDFTEKVTLVLGDIAKIARESGFEEKGQARVGEFNRQLGQRGREIWSEEHKPQIARRSGVVFDHEAPAQAASASIDQQMRNNNPAAARAVDKWIANNLTPENIGTVGKADNAMRSYNATNPDVPEPYKNLMRIAQGKAMDAIRAGLEAKLQFAGEEGVSNPNSRYGAIKEIRDALDTQVNNAPNAPLSGWKTLQNASRTGGHGSFAGAGIGGAIGAIVGAPAEGAAIGGGIGAAAGTVGSVIHDVMSQPGSRIARAMKGLGKTNLQPDTVQTPGFITNPQTSLVPGVGGITPPPPQTPVSGVLPAGWTPEMLAERAARENAVAPPTVASENASAVIGSPNSQILESNGRLGGIRIEQPEGKGIKGLLPAPAPPVETRIGTLPTASNTEGVEGKRQEITRLPSQAPEGTPERRGSVRDLSGPDFYRTARMNELRKAAEAGDELAKTQLEDMKANPFEKHQGADINQVKAMNKPTMTREEAEAATEERKTGRNQRFGETPEGVLPGMGEHVAKQAEGAAKVKGEELTAEMNRPKNVDEAAGEMERKSTLFRGTAASPQGELLKPMEKPNLEEQKKMFRVTGWHPEGGERELGMIEAHTRDEAIRKSQALGEPDLVRDAEEAPNKIIREEEPIETQVKGITAKEPRAEKSKTAKPVPVAKKYGMDVILDAEGLLNQESGMMAAGDRPGVYYDEYTEETSPLTQNQDFRHGERAGGKWRGVKSTRDMHPFMAEHPEWGPEYIQKALRNKDGAAYQKVMEAAIKFIRDANRSPEEKAAAGEKLASSWAPIVAPKTSK